METKWLSAGGACDRLILAGDIGGTNTNLALVAERRGRFEIVLECIFATQEIDSLLEPIERTLAEARRRDPALAPRLCCISGAGPVEDNYCTLTNARWRIDGEEIRKAFDLPTLVINDFQALGYSLPLLDPGDPNQILTLPHSDGSRPAPEGSTRAVLGAGTGLGVGFLIERDGRPLAYPSEGGHIGFAPFDAESTELRQYVVARMSEPPGVEPFLSGQGLTNIFHFYRHTGRMALTGVAAAIDRAPDSEKPRLVASHAGSDAACRAMLRLFIRIYGSFASDVAALLLPTQGVFLAGGIVMRNAEFFLEDGLFMENFERNYKPNIRAVLESIPVYIIKDYSVSLYGAANAARWLLD